MVYGSICITDNSKTAQYFRRLSVKRKLLSYFCDPFILSPLPKYLLLLWV